MGRIGALSLLLVAACGVAPRCPECGGSSGMAGRSSSIERCDAASTMAPVAWEAVSGLGSPQEAFAGAERVCETDLRWNGAAFDNHNIEPRMGQTRVTVGLVLDHGSALFIAPEDSARSMGCVDRLEVDGRVELMTADGTFQTASDVALVRTGLSGPLIYEVIEDVEASRGRLSIGLHQGERGSMTYLIDGTGTACAGEIHLTIAMGSDVGGGRLAHWSDSGCELSARSIDLTTPLAGEGRTLIEVIERAWGHATFSGVWQDGNAAVLDLRVEPSGAVGCREPSGTIVIPVRATYATSDGRLPERTVNENVRATVSEDGRVQLLEFSLTDVMACADEHEALDYALADCSAVESATVQILLSIQGSSGPSRASDGGLNVYFMQRRGDTPPMNHRLAL